MLHAKSTGAEINNIDNALILIPDWVANLEKDGYTKNTQNTYKKHVMNHFMMFLRHLFEEESSRKPTRTRITRRRRQRLRLRRNQGTTMSVSASASAPTPTIPVTTLPSVVPVIQHEDKPENQVVVHNKCREGRGMQKPNQPLRRGGNIDVVEETDESEEPTHNLFVILLFLIEIYMFLQLIM
jgi:hypothetical protein